MKLQLPGKKTRYWQVFWLCLLAAAALFAPHCLVDAVAGGGYFHYAGDFNDQQINFYQYANSFIKQGGSFSWATDLGSGFVNSYSFYLLGSPFFWLTLLVPARFMPWMLVPLLCLKIALAGGGSYLWARRWVRDEDWSMLAGCLYAFSGFTVYNIFFNHFHEAIVFFPLLLVGLEELIVHNRRGVFALAVAINAFVNYWFFIGEVVFVVLYVFLRMTDRSWGMTVKRFCAVALESVLGLCLAMVVLLPSVLAIMGNPRTTSDNLLYGWNFWIYSTVQRIPQILQTLFFPPELPSRPNFFPDGGAK